MNIIFELFFCVLGGEAAESMRSKLLLVHLVGILSVHQSCRPAAASGAPITSEMMSQWCAHASMEDLMETREACRKAESSGSGAECWAYLDTVLQLCLEETAAAGHLDSTDRLGLLKRNRNNFLWQRKRGSRNSFLGKREPDGRLRDTINTFWRNRMPAEDGEKRSRNKFLGKRTDFQSMEKKSRNGFLGKRDDDLNELSRLMTLDTGEDDKRSRNLFLGKKDHKMDIKRSRNKFLGKRGHNEKQPMSALEETHS